MIRYSYATVSPDALTEGLFDFSFPPYASPVLQESIREAGILSPLLMVRREDTHHLFDGHRRMDAARRMKMARVPVALLPKLSPEKTLSLWIQVQKSHRALNPFEVARLVRRGAEAFLLSRQDLLRILARESSLPPATLSELPVILNLPDRLKHEAVRRTYSAHFLTKISTLYDDELLTLTSRLLDSFSVSENQLSHLLTWVDEIAKRDRRPPSEVFSADPLPFIISHPSMSTAKKRDAFLKAIYRMRYPGKAALDAAFREIERKLETVGGVRIVPPQDFAGDRFELRISFRNAADLDHRLKRIEAFRHEIDALGKLV